MLAIRELGMQYAGKILFTDVNLNLNKNNRYGLIGANGAGKSTFFRILTGEEEASIGEAVFQKGSSVGWLRQDLLGLDDELIVNVVIAGKKELWQAMQEKEKLLAKDDFSEKDGYELAELEEKIAHYGGYEAESEAEKLLTGLGIPAAKHFDQLSTLSGGFKLRVLLAQSLFQNPDVLLLDEPTNHLDIFSIKWLESYLKREYQGLLVFISHDSDFLNNLATHILDIDYHEIISYTGNYDKFRTEKNAKHELLLTQKEAVDKRIDKMRVFVERFRAKASRAKQSASREKLIDKMEIPEIKQTTRAAPGFLFTKERPSGKVVTKIDNICKNFGEKKVLNNISFIVNRGEKVAIIGQNGIGKSTLLKILVDEIKADQGTYEWGFETKIGYFSQDHHDQLNTSTSILNWTEERCSSFAPVQTMRKVLGQMLFAQDEVHKNILDISGGECARVLFANIMLKNPNVIVLDEPTNHMDIEAIDSLAKALKKYDGTVIFVSHDRHFISKFADRIVTLTPNGIKDFNGSYNDFEKGVMGG